MEGFVARGLAAVGFFDRDFTDTRSRRSVCYVYAGLICYDGNEYRMLTSIQLKTVALNELSPYTEGTETKSF